MEWIYEHEPTAFDGGNPCEEMWQDDWDDMEDLLDRCGDMTMEAIEEELVTRQMEKDLGLPRDPRPLRPQDEIGNEVEHNRLYYRTNTCVDDLWDFCPWGELNVLQVAGTIGKINALVLKERINGLK